MCNIGLDIEDFGASGEGVARLDGKVYFVPFTLKDEKVEAKILKDGKSFSKCELHKILIKSKYRVNPKCKYFGICGGCNFQHIDRQIELQIKEKNIENALRKYANHKEKVLPIIYDCNEYSYRNKLTVFCKSLNNEFIFGMYKEKTHTFIEIKKCEIVKEEINSSLMNIKKFVNENFGIFKNADLKSIMFRVLGKNVQVVFLVSHWKTCELKGLDKIQKIVASLYVCENCNNQLLTGRLFKIYGELNMQYKMLDVNALMHPFSFMQVNDGVASLLYNYVLKLVEGKVVVNAYSGAGLLSMLLSKKAKTVIGIDISKEATQNANNLIEYNSIFNVQNICGDCEKILKFVIEENNADVLILDPPRKGVSEKNIIEVNKSNVKKIVYISCNFATLSRDLLLLDNYNILTITPFDMFPNTANVETVVEMERK